MYGLVKEVVCPVGATFFWLITNGSAGETIALAISSDISPQPLVTPLFTLSEATDVRFKACPASILSAESVSYTKVSLTLSSSL